MKLNITVPLRLKPHNDDLIRLNRSVLLIMKRSPIEI